MTSIGARNYAPGSWNSTPSPVTITKLVTGFTTEFARGDAVAIDPADYSATFESLGLDDDAIEQRFLAQVTDQAGKHVLGADIRVQASVFPVLPQDLRVLAYTFGGEVHYGAWAQSTPEPAMLALVGLGGLCLVCRGFARRTALARREVNSWRSPPPSRRLIQ